MLRALLDSWAIPYRDEQVASCVATAEVLSLDCGSVQVVTVTFCGHPLRPCAVSSSLLKGRGALTSEESVQVCRLGAYLRCNSDHGYELDLSHRPRPGPLPAELLSLRFLRREAFLAQFD